MVVEVGVRGAIVGGEVSHGGSPTGRVGLVAFDVRRDVGTLEVPNSDPGFVPHHYDRSARCPAIVYMTRTGVDTTVDVVETGSIGIVIRLVPGTATLVGGIHRSAVIRVVAAGSKSRQLVVVHVSRHVAALPGMKGDLVLGESVDALKDIDLATLGPVGTVLPPCWPGTASGWHMVRVHEHHSPGPAASSQPSLKHQVLLNLHKVAVDTDGLAAAPHMLGSVDLHDSMSVPIDRHKTAVPSVRGGLEIHSPVSRVIVAPEVEVVEEIATGLFLSALTSHSATELTQVSTRFQSLFEFFVGDGLADEVVEVVLDAALDHTVVEEEGEPQVVVVVEEAPAQLFCPIDEVSDSVALDPAKDVVELAAAFTEVVGET